MDNCFNKPLMAMVKCYATYVKFFPSRWYDFTLKKNPFAEIFLPSEKRQWEKVEELFQLGNEVEYSTHVWSPEIRERNIIAHEFWGNIETEEEYEQLVAVIDNKASFEERQKSWKGFLLGACTYQLSELQIADLMNSYYILMPEMIKRQPKIFTTNLLERFNHYALKKFVNCAPAQVVTTEILKYLFSLEFLNLEKLLALNLEKVAPEDFWILEYKYDSLADLWFRKISVEEALSLYYATWRRQTKGLPEDNQVLVAVMNLTQFGLFYISERLKAEGFPWKKRALVIGFAGDEEMPRNKKKNREDPNFGDKKTKDFSSHLTPSQIKAFLDQYVIEQDMAKKILAVAVYNHYKRLNCHGVANNVEIAKSNVFLIGPSGSGKTLLVQTLAKVLNVPFAIADATTLTEAGYVGEDVESIVAKLLQAANNDVKKAERGIIYIDEIDKIRKHSGGGTRDISGEGVQQMLLKIIEGKKVNVPLSRKGSQGGVVQVDTTNILFICGGAFVGLDKNSVFYNGSPIGFGSANRQSESKTNTVTTVNPVDLVKFGMIPELVGRVPVIARLSDLSKPALRRVLVEPKNSLLKQYESLFAMDKVKLTFTEDALSAMAEKAIVRKTGARGLRAIVENVLLNLMYEIPDKKGLTEIVINKEVIDEKQDPQYVENKSDRP